MVSKNLKSEVRKAKKAHQQTIGNDEVFVTTEALKQVIYSSQNPENFENRFIAAVSVFNILVHKGEKFDKLKKAQDLNSAIEVFHDASGSFYNKLKDQEITSQEMFVQMQEGINGNSSGVSKE